MDTIEKIDEYIKERIQTLSSVIPENDDFKSSNDEIKSKIASMFEHSPQKSIHDISLPKSSSDDTIVQDMDLDNLEIYDDSTRIHDILSAGYEVLPSESCSSQVDSVNDDAISTPTIDIDALEESPKKITETLDNIETPNETLKLIPKSKVTPEDIEIKNITDKEIMEIKDNIPMEINEELSNEISLNNDNIQNIQAQKHLLDETDSSEIIKKQVDLKEISKETANQPELSNKDETTNDPSFVDEIIESIVTPGISGRVLGIMHGSFIALTMTLLVLFVLTLSMHVVFLLTINVALWITISWFVKEISMEQEKKSQ